jgi:hypothetical protein
LYWWIRLVVIPFIGALEVLDSGSGDSEEAGNQNERSPSYFISVSSFSGMAQLEVRPCFHNDKLIS